MIRKLQFKKSSKTIFRIGRGNICLLVILLLSGSAIAQNIDTAIVTEPHGKLYGMTFGDLSYKGNADALNRGVNQYSAYPANTNMAQFRRIYLGYIYYISPRFTAECIMAAESDYQSGVLGQASSGDLLADNKFSPYIKYANLRYKNLWKGTDLVVGQVNGPAYGINGRNWQTSEEIWGYRSIEKTVSDIRGTNCFDMGAELQGWLDRKGNFGYDLMVGNGTQAKPATTQYKWFYGDVYAKFLNKRLIFDIYQDYDRLNWGTYVAGAKAGQASPNGAWYHDRNTTKFFTAWTTPKLTVGFEGYHTTILGDVKVLGKDNNYYYRTTNAMAMSLFVRGRILSDHSGSAKLGFFARFDNFDPTGNLDNIINNANTKSYSGLTAAYEPTTKEQFLVAGFDYTPFKNVHIMPNLWMDTYTSSLTQTLANENMNTQYINNNKGTDLVWRLTFYYIYGK